MAATEEKKDMKIYFDNASTTKVDDRVYNEMLPYFNKFFGNPSSMHSFGEDTGPAVEAARKSCAELTGSRADEIYFTSCGTESNNTALWGIARAYKEKGNHIITSAIEHYSILNPLKEMQKEGFEVTVLPVDKSGFVNPEDVKKALKSTTVLVSIMHANNEIGTIQNIKKIAKIVKESGALMHSDGMATAGIIPVDVNDMGIDSYSFSAQQMYGPKGAAALYLKKGVKIRPLLLGGTQERGRRAGTENVPAIVGFGKACSIAGKEMDNNYKYIKSLRDRLASGIKKSITDVKYNGDIDNRLPGNAHFSFEYIEGESIILLLNSKGIAAASGSSCASHALKSSHVLLAIKLSPATANGSILFSLGKYNTETEVGYTLEVLPQIVSKLREMSPLCGKKG